MRNFRDLTPRDHPFAVPPLLEQARKRAPSRLSDDQHGWRRWHPSFHTDLHHGGDVWTDAAPLSASFLTLACQRIH